MAKSILATNPNSLMAGYPMIQAKALEVTSFLARISETLSKSFDNLTDYFSNNSAQKPELKCTIDQEDLNVVAAPPTPTSLFAVEGDPIRAAREARDAKLLDPNYRKEPIARSLFAIEGREDPIRAARIAQDSINCGEFTWDGLRQARVGRSFVQQLDLPNLSQAALQKKYPSGSASTHSLFAVNEEGLARAERQAFEALARNTLLSTAELTGAV